MIRRLNRLTLCILFSTLSACQAIVPNWQAQTSGTTDPLNGVWFVSSLEGWAVGGPINNTRAVILHTVDGGQTWKPQTSPVAKRLFAVQFTDSLHGWASGQDNTILATSNGGINWSVQPAPGSDLLAPLRGLWMVDSTHGWVCSDEGGVYSTQNGTSWTWLDLRQCPTCPVNNLIAIHFFDAMHGATAGQTGYMFHTTDGGVSWSPMTIPDPPYARPIYALHFVGASELYMAGSLGRIYRSTDSGTSWTQQTTNTTAILYALAANSASNLWAAGQNGVLLHTTDGGAQWRPQWTGTSNALRALAVSGSSEAWAVGDGGTILHTTTANQDYTPGDVDGNGTFNAGDVAAALRIYGGLAPSDRGAVIYGSNIGAPVPLSILTAVRLARSPLG